MVENDIFYRTFIDPLLASGRNNIAATINSGETVLDVACGTGALVFELAKKSSWVVGTDLSESMIVSAKKRKNKQALNNTEFLQADATHLVNFGNHEFDVVTLSMALHQFAPNLHAQILSELKRVAKKIIIVDYSVDLPRNLSGYFAKTVEFLAGKEHFQNFKKYSSLGGLQKILPQNQINIESVKYFSSGIFQLAVCSKL